MIIMLYYHSNNCITVVNYSPKYINYLVVSEYIGSFMPRLTEAIRLAPPPIFTVLWSLSFPDRTLSATGKHGGRSYCFILNEIP